MLGGLNAERGKVGRDFGPFLRAPTPGETGGLRLREVVAMENCSSWFRLLAVAFSITDSLKLSHVYPSISFIA